MADTFLRPVIDKLVQLLGEEAILLKGVHGEVKNLKDELEILEPFLRDAESKLARGEVSDAAKVWLKQLREEADHIEDVVNEYVYHVEQHRHQGGFIGSLRKAGHFLKALKPRHHIASEIRGIGDSLRKIKERGQSYGLRPFEQGGSSSTTTDADTIVDPRIATLFVEDEELVGIESMSNELARSLVEGPSMRTVISLVGEGGVGKTTLAKKVYNDVVAAGYFDCHVWITISQSYNMETILKKLKNHVCPTTKQPGGEMATIEELITLLRNSLTEKRYVVVFDDVWQTDFWGVIKHALPSNGKGSRIILTTRNALVVESFKETLSDVVQQLKTWSTEQAWKLFCQKAFRCSKSEGCCPPDLKQLSHEILSKCQGLPLAIVAVAGLLSKKEKSKVEWQKVLDNLNYEFEENCELSKVSKVLLLSYQELPYHLKLCFLYFGLFPEDFSIREERLYRLWIAEGFMKLRRDKTLEQIAEEYLTELINRNLVSFDLQYGFERWCKVHDLIREMILTRINDLCFCQIIDEDKLRFKGRSRRLSIYGTIENILKIAGDSKIYSILLHNSDESANSFVFGLFKNFKLLKVFDFTNAPLDNLPKEVGKLFYLRYLCLRGTKVKMLPKSIGKLQNLQTLDVGYTLVRELPIEINMLRKLRHLLAFMFDGETESNLSPYRGVRIYEGIGRLEELQTLTRVEAYSYRVGFAKELQKLTKLKTLDVSNVTTGMGKALGESIEKMNHLKKLQLTAINEDEVLDLKFISSPPLFLCYLGLYGQLQELPGWILELHNLQGLELLFSRLINEPLKCLKDLPNLAFLRLHQAYDGDELHFKEGGFQKLKTLHLTKLKGLKEVKIDRGALPLLEKLSFGPSPLMKDMRLDVQHLPNLKSLGITDMPREFVIALQPDGGIDYWRIQHIPFVTFRCYTGRGDKYNTYKLGSTKLLQRLQEQVN